MKIVVSVAPLLWCLLIASCASGPVSYPEDAVSAAINVTESSVQSNTHYDYNPGMMMSDGNGPGKYVVNAIIFPFYTAIKIGTNFAQGLSLYVYPENYQKHFTQQISFGSNSVWLPKQFVAERGRLIFEARGSRSGKWAIRHDPNSANNVIYIDPAQSKL